jgi:hypothetical protein
LRMLLDSPTETTHTHVMMTSPEEHRKWFWTGIQPT